MQSVKTWVRENSSLLFKHAEGNTLLALFDDRGFNLASDAQNAHNRIKNQPHLYVAWTHSENGYYYIGKSFQSGGRWKRQHAYHLGTLAHHLLDNVRNDDQNHSHWIKTWMIGHTVAASGDMLSIQLIMEVYICFIPFRVYSNQDYMDLEKSEIRQINSEFERQLISSYREENITLLNIRHNNI